MGTTGIQELNAVNEAARFDAVLSNYFRLSNAAAKRRRDARPRCVPSHGGSQDAATGPDTSLQQLKRLVRDAPTPLRSQYIQKLHTTILYQLQRANQSPVLLSRTVDLCHELFQRSVEFRALVVPQTAAFFEQLLVAAGEHPSANVSRALRVKGRGVTQVKKVLMLIETWTQDFGERYPSLVAGHAVLMDRGYAFPKERERLQQEREHAADTRRTRQRVTTVKKQQRDREMKRYVLEMEQGLVEMNRAFEILVPTLDAFLGSNGQELLADGNAEHSAHVKKDARNDMGGSDKSDEHDTSNVEWDDVAVPSAARRDEEEEDVTWENVATDSGCTRDSALSNLVDEDNVDSNLMGINDIVQAYGLGSSSYHLTVEVSKQICQESAENDALFRSLADGALRMRKRFLPLLDDWEQYSTIDPSASSNSSSQSQREVLQQIRDLRDRITRVLLKWEDLVQGSKNSKQYTSTRSAVVSLPLDAYNPPTKRRRQEK